MLSNLLLVLTTILYIALAIFVLTPVNATGERLVGWGMIALVLVVAYIVCSLLLTISLASKGVFHWIPGTASRRKMIVAVLWFGLVAGVVICTIAKTEFPKGHQSSGLPGFLSYPFYFGAAWLPLLMLVPFACLSNPAWNHTLSPALGKTLLVTGCVIGFLLLMAPKIIALTGVFNNYKSEKDIQNDLRLIENETSIIALLAKTAEDENEQIRTAALNRIKAQPNLEDELILILEQDNPWYFIWLYSFLADNKMEHPESFINPINKSIPRLASYLYDEALQNSWKGEATYHLLNAEPLFRLLDEQFKNSREQFRPAIVKLKQTMNTKPAKRDGDKARFYEALNKYRLAVKNWLNQH